ncbi:hypothetical protein [Actinacidiphila sp. ITFR-21]|uniref:hypothetical protein n=1 Tax=Actinacidiphila sp. ITFR-21 TaxID=3075199 RepID=UPI00288BB359|nr:hypothetical protein [Streptomyces sp. ITFR-21]WNI20002.1 hypothetical protein RLT57_31160 [Streptomyces sp. ITFR-21]
MTVYAHPELNLTDPGKGYAHFVLYTEPRLNVAGAAWNATINIELDSPYVQEWVDRLQRCEPNALHTTFVMNREIPRLFHPCVDEDKTSPAANGGNCHCFRTWTDPEYGLPVVGRHSRSAGQDRWIYMTYAPLALRPDDVVYSVVADRGDVFWARTTGGVLAVLPMLESSGYGAGPRSGTGGASTFGAYLQQLVDSEGRDTAAKGRDTSSRQLVNWVRSDAAHRQELVLRDLAATFPGFSPDTSPSAETPAQ